MSRNGFRDTVATSAVVQELIERGFTTLTPSSPPRELYSQLVELTRLFPKVQHDPSDVKDVSYTSVLQTDTMHEKKVVTFERRGGFCVLQMSPSFYGAYIDLSLFGLNSLMDGLNGTARREDFSNLVVAGDAPGRELRNKPVNSIDNRRSDALLLLHNADHLVQQARLCLRIAKDFELTQFFNISIGPYATDLGITTYDPHSSTFASDQLDHIDSGISESVVISIQLTPGNTPWVIGRDKDALETIHQEQAEIVIMDTHGAKNRRQPIHVVQAGDEARVSVVIVLHGQQRDHFLEALPGLAEKWGWAPTPVGERNMWSPAQQNLETQPIGSR